MFILEIPDMIRYMHFRSVDRSKTYEIPSDQLTSSTTVEELRTRLLNQYYPDGTKTIIFVHSGRTLTPEQTLAEASVDLDDTLIMVIRNAPASTPTPQTVLQVGPNAQATPLQADVPASEPEPERTRARAQTQTQTQTRYVIGEGSGGTYQQTYTGKDIKEAIKKSTDLLLDVMHLIGHQNPFFLSYIATNPSKARDFINETLDSDEFKLVVKAGSVTEDPIKPLITHPSGGNGYEIDMRNIRHIMKGTDVVETEDSLALARELYLLHDRDIQRTFEAINNPDNMLIIPTNST